MRVGATLCAKALLALVAVAPQAKARPSSPGAQDISPPGQCRHLPGDAGWPKVEDWAALNVTVGGRLLQGVPIGHECYGATPNAAACAEVRRTWQQLAPFLEDPVNVISAYFQNDTCSPFYGPLSSDFKTRNATCSLGSLASYAVNVSDAATVIASVQFARRHNIRLIVKNTGHDILGRSTGKGALALWTHHLKETSIFQYDSDSYSGPAARIGAGIQVLELYKAVAAAGYRATGGSCPTVGAAGGWIQSAGHGPLASKYGLGADQTLQFEVVTTDGRHLNASRTENSDLYWALSGGGPSNYAIVLSVTMKIYPDGPVAGSRLTFAESNPEKYWAAVEAWQRHLFKLDDIPGFQTLVLLSGNAFVLNYATLPDASEADVTAALSPFYDQLALLNITATANETLSHNSFLEHYLYYERDVVYTRNVTVGNRIIPRTLVSNAAGLQGLTEVYKEIVAVPNAFVYIISQNVTHARVGNKPGDNPVLPAWRDSLFSLNFGILSEEKAPFPEISSNLASNNAWQGKLRELTPGGGSYMNEATYNFPHWKEDYYGDQYEKLAAIKKEYDGDYVLWSQPSAGGDAFELKPDGRLCKIDA